MSRIKSDGDQVMTFHWCGEKHRGIRVLVLVSMLLCNVAMAEMDAALAPKHFDLSGFGTLGVAQTSSNDAQFSRDQTQPGGIDKSLSTKLDSLIGLQAYFRVNDSLELVTQAISRYGPHGDYRPEISWAFAKYSFNPSLSVRAGRMGTEFYLLADSRHVGYSYLTVRPSVDFFGQLAFHYVDGIDLTGIVPLGHGLLKGKVFAGYSHELAPIANEFLSLRGNPMLGGYVDYQEGNWQWRATFAEMTFKHELPAPVSTLRDLLYQAGTLFPSATEAADAIGLKDKASRFYSVGGVYDRGPLQVQAMLSEMRHESSIYQNSKGGYLLAGYRMGQLTPFAGYSWTKSKERSLSAGLPNVFPFADLNAGLATSLARVHTDQHTYTLGARWDFRQDMALKAQVDMIRGTPQSIFLYPSNTSNFDGKLNVFSLALDFVF